MKQDLRALTPEQLAEIVTDLNQPAYRAGQIARWLAEGVSDFSEMTNLPAALRAQLEQQFIIGGVTVLKKQVSVIDGTVKYLFLLPDGETVESVLMKYDQRKPGLPHWSQCISTQVGCRMGCGFCATGTGGLTRNLTAAEMISQIETAQKDSAAAVSSVVLMGMGEPLDNLDNVLSFLHMLSQPGGVHIGMRHVSVSTCGLVDKIKELERHRLQLTLSVSLHAPNDRLRGQIMPVNRRWPVEELLTACRRYAETTGRRVSFEYAMIDRFNDGGECARELAERLKGMLCHVNLIPVNPVEGSRYRPSPRARIAAFMKILEHARIPVTVRRTLGADILASCGQLKAQSSS